LLQELRVIDTAHVARAVELIDLGEHGIGPAVFEESRDAFLGEQTAAADDLGQHLRQEEAAFRFVRARGTVLRKRALDASSAQPSDVHTRCGPHAIDNRDGRALLHPRNIALVV
jgi:hypothetical protein